MTNPLGHIDTTIYNEFNQPVATINPLGDRTTAVYDDAGQSITSINSLGNRSTTVYDNAGQQIRSEDPLSNLSTTVYDAADRLLTVTDLDSSGTSTVNASGEIRNNSPLTVSVSMNHNSSFTYTAAGTASTGDDLTINNSAVITLDSGTASTLTFNAGDGVSFDTGRVVTQGGGTHTVDINADTESDTGGGGTEGTVRQTGTTLVSVTTNNLDISASEGIGQPGVQFRTSVDPRKYSVNLSRLWISTRSWTRFFWPSARSSGCVSPMQTILIRFRATPCRQRNCIALRQRK